MDQSLSDLLFNCNFEAGNSLNIAVTAIVGQHSQVTEHCVARSAILAGNSFIARCHVTSKYNQWERALSGKNFQPYNKRVKYYWTSDARKS